MDLDVRAAPEVEQPAAHLRRVPVVARLEQLVVQVDAQHGVRQVRDGVGQDLEHRERIHVGAQALHVHAHGERPRAAARGPDEVPLDHVRMAQHPALPVPAVRDHRGGARGQGEEFVGAPDQDVQLLVVPGRVGLVGIAQVVHRVHERFAQGPQLADDVGERRGGHGVEAEMDVEHVEVAMVRADPPGVEHQRRPPAAGNGATVGRRRVGQPGDLAVAVGCRQVADVDVGSRDGGDAHRGPRGGHLGDRRRRRSSPFAGLAGGPPCRTAVNARWSACTRGRGR
ncbi:hypothetical protein ACWEQ0_06760 [Nocardia thailandica]